MTIKPLLWLAAFDQWAQDDCGRECHLYGSLEWLIVGRWEESCIKQPSGIKRCFSCFFFNKRLENMYRPLIKAGENKGSRDTASRRRLSQETKWNTATTNMGTPSSPPPAFFHPASCPFHALLPSFLSSPPHSPPLHFASFHPLICAREGRCLHAGCQVTGLIEGSPESCCYQSLNPFTPLSLCPL